MFIDEHRGSYGVEPICAVLPIAPSTYYAHKAMQADPTLRSVRAHRDELLKAELQRAWMHELRGLRGEEGVEAAEPGRHHGGSMHWSSAHEGSGALQGYAKAALRG